MTECAVIKEKEYYYAQKHFQGGSLNDNKSKRIDG
jgi:hypothetical protein